MRALFNFLLLIAIGTLTYLCIVSVVDPIHFNREREAREAIVIKRLENIRKAEIVFRNRFGHYTANADSLILFIKYGKLPVIEKQGFLNEDQLRSGLTEKKAMKIINSGNLSEIKKYNLEHFRRDTAYVNISDSLFDKGFSADSLLIVPGTDKMFELETGEIITASGYPVKLFEARTPYEVYLDGLDKQSIVNLRDNEEKRGKYPGLKVGSVVEINNNAGNWE